MQQEYIEELYEKVVDDLDNHDGVVTHLEPDVLRWALGTQVGLRKHYYTHTKKKNLEEVMEFQLSYFKS